jgi:alpha-L-fucosidase
MKKAIRQKLFLISSSFAVIGLIAAAMSFSGKQAAAVSQANEQTLQRIEAVAKRGPFQPDWKSLENYKIPAWYQDAKFGIFIHWGVYSVPGFGNEWYPRRMYDANDRAKIQERHVATFGPLTTFGYKDFIPQFKAEKFSAEAWARLFKKAGAKYVIPVAEHHDGFPMYDSAYTPWSAAKMGPKRDVIGELAKAVRNEGMVFGVSSHRAENWWFYGEGRKVASDVTDERYRQLYGPARDRKESEDQKTPPDKAFLDDWLLRASELVDKYQPQVVWFDWWIAQPAFHPYLQTFSAYYYNRGAEWKKGVAINYKKHGGESFPDTAGVLDIERGQLANKRDLFWQTDTSVSTNSWGYIKDHKYRTVNSLVDDLIDIVSKNGCLLLNIGPKPDGAIPEPEEKMLLEIGQWLAVNGEAIYGTRPWKVFGEGPSKVAEGPFAERNRKDFTAEDIRFTARGNTLYAIALDWPASGELTIKSVAQAKVKSVSLLGYSGKLKWRQTAGGLTVTLPAQKTGEHAFTLKINGGGLVAQ